jgi:hypothetical protein
MLSRKFCCGGDNAVIKKYLGTTVEDDILFEVGLFKCTKCQQATIRKEQRDGQLAKVQLISNEEESKILYT